MFVDYNKDTEKVVFNLFSDLTKGVCNDKRTKD
jgi:hypothetical protein